MVVLGCCGYRKEIKVGSVERNLLPLELKFQLDIITNTLWAETKNIPAHKEAK